MFTFGKCCHDLIIKKIQFSRYHTKLFDCSILLFWAIRIKYARQLWNSNLNPLQVVGMCQEELRTKGRRRQDGLKVQPSCYPSFAWCWWPLSTTGVKRNSSGDCRAASSWSSDSLWCAMETSSRSLLLRWWLGTWRRSNMVSFLFCWAQRMEWMLRLGLTHLIWGVD